MFEVRLGSWQRTENRDWCSFVCIFKHHLAIGYVPPFICGDVSCVKSWLYFTWLVWVVCLSRFFLWDIEEVCAAKLWPGIRVHIPYPEYLILAVLVVFFFCLFFFEGCFNKINWPNGTCCCLCAVCICNWRHTCVFLLPQRPCTSSSQRAKPGHLPGGQITPRERGGHASASHPQPGQRVRVNANLITA